MTKQEFFDLLKKYEEGRCTEEGKAIFDHFYDTFDKQTSRWDDWDLSTKERIRLDIYTKMRRGIAKTTLHRKPRSSVAWRIAASVLLILGIGYLIYMKDHTPEIRYLTRTTGRGEKATLTLSDGSVIQLNSESSVTFPEKFMAGSRKVSLTGEAFFEVTKNPDKPFIIQSEDLITTVLGTSFNIQAYPENSVIEVTVATGKVRVETAIKHAGSGKDPDRSILFPNQQAFYNKTSNVLGKRDIDLHPYLAWKEGVIVLDKVSVSEAARILERWYDVKFKFENETIRQCIISGEFRNDKIVNILENIKFLTGIDYRMEPDNQILLEGQPSD